MPCIFILAFTGRKNSTFDLYTIDLRLFQLHLERIANYLCPGEGIWWHHKTETNEIVFHDGDEYPEQFPHGPELLQFVTTTLTDAQRKVT